MTNEERVQRAHEEAARVQQMIADVQARAAAMSHEEIVTLLWTQSASAEEVARLHEELLRNAGSSAMLELEIVRQRDAHAVLVQERNINHALLQELLAERSAFLSRTS